MDISRFLFLIILSLTKVIAYMNCSKFDFWSTFLLISLSARLILLLGIFEYCSSMQLFSKIVLIFFYSHSYISGRKKVPYSINNKIPLLWLPCFFCAFHRNMNLLFHRCSHTCNSFGWNLLLCFVMLEWILMTKLEFGFWK